MKEVNYEEYLALKKRVEELENRQVKDVPLASGWAYAVEELPISGYRLYDSAAVDPTAYYDRSTLEAWRCLTKLAKQVHEGNSFHLRGTRIAYSADYRKYWERKSDKVITDHKILTYEQKLLSLEMLNELIPIYNKYYKLAHPDAPFFDATGKVLDVPIIDEKRR